MRKMTALMFRRLGAAAERQGLPDEVARAGKSGPDAKASDRRLVQLAALVSHFEQRGDGFW